MYGTDRKNCPMTVNLNCYGKITWRLIFDERRTAHGWTEILAARQLVVPKLERSVSQRTWDNIAELSSTARVIDGWKLAPLRVMLECRIK